LLERLYATDRTNHRLGAALARTYLQQALSMVYTQGAQRAESSAARALTLAIAHRDGLTDEFERTKLLADAYWGKGILACTTAKYAECTEATEKMISIAEAYARAHPDEARAYEGLSNAYGNAAIIDDPRKPKDEIVARSIGLTRKAMAAEQKLVTLHPDDVSYAWRLAESQFNLGNTLIDKEDYNGAIEQLTLAGPVLAARAADKNDLRARLVSLMVETTLAWAQFKVGRVAEAEKALLACEAGFADLLTRYDNLQVTFYLGQTRMRLGEIYSQSAASAGRAQLAHWRKARDFLARGKADVEKVRAAVSLEGTEEDMYRVAVENLEKAEAAVARLSGAR
jgi:tetratricopeptide (TPR) repeat protein